MHTVSECISNTTSDGALMGISFVNRSDTSEELKVGGNAMWSSTSNFQHFQRHFQPVESNSQISAKRTLQQTPTDRVYFSIHFYRIHLPKFTLIRTCWAPLWPANWNCCRIIPSYRKLLCEHWGCTYIQLREVCQDLGQPVVVILLGVLHLPHIELPDPMDLVMLMNDSRGLPLSLGQRQIDEVLQTKAAPSATSRHDVTTR